MYTKPVRIYTDKSGMENYIEGTDVYNSLLLFYLQEPGLETLSYTIKTPYRTDIIAEEVYGSVKYESYVILQLKAPITALIRGAEISLLTQSELLRIIDKI